MPVQNNPSAKRDAPTLKLIREKSQKNKLGERIKAAAITLQHAIKMGSICLHLALMYKEAPA